MALVACAAFGGSNRAEVPMLIVLRPLLVAALAVLLLAGPDHEARSGFRHDTLFWLFGAWMLAIAWQLVPLPPAIWTALPGRAAVAQVGTVGGFALGWHAVSLAPDRTWNSLLALLPAAVMLVSLTRLRTERHRSLVTLLLGIALVDMLIAVLQAGTGKSSIFYFYRGTNDGGLAGLFANRNHNIVFLVAMLPLLDAWARLSVPSREQRNVRRVMAGSIAAMIVMLALIAGSRAGLLLLGLCIITLVAVHHREFLRLSRMVRIVLATAAASSIALMILLALMFGRAQSVERLISGSQSENRLVNLPIVARIVQDHFPFGSGFGTFDPVFRGYEPDALLKPTYFNHAHNDLLEVAMTGGLPALLVLIAFLVWFASGTIRTFRNRVSGEERRLARAAAVAIVMLLLGSLVDYPIRTPFLTAVLAILCVLLQAGKGARHAKASWLQARGGIDKGNPAAPPDLQ